MWRLICIPRGYHSFDKRYSTLNKHKKIGTFARDSQVSDSGFPMVIYEKIYLEAYKYNQQLTNISVQLDFTLGRVDQSWKFSILRGDASDIHRGSTVHVVKIHFLLEHL